MVAGITPGGGIITVRELEVALRGEQCVKVGPCTQRVCMWKTPNGHHFMAPNPMTMNLCPDKSQTRVMKTVAMLKKLPAKP
jgi:hypothetical protein